jgi:dihydropteroate synthase
MEFLWKHRRGTLDLTARGAVMGVLNVTPDSFSDGGQFVDAERAVAHGLAMVEAGAALIDLGGESTRPGAEPVPAAEQIRRTRPVIEALRRRSGVLISIDTTLAAVAEAALAAGADIVNDVSGLRGDAEMAGVCARTGAGVVIMHMQGEPRTMQAAPHYDDVVAEVSSFFRWQLAVAEAAGVVREAVVFDPGIGFGKTLEHNLALIRALGVLSPIPGRPVVLGVSRKSFLGRLLGSEDLADRAWPTVALTSLGRELGARVFRVHEVRPNEQALRMTEAVLGAEAADSLGRGAAADRLPAG